MTTKCMAPAIGLILLGAASVAQGQALADRVPADALFYVGWAGTDALGTQFDNSHLNGVIETLDVPRLWTSLREAIVHMAAERSPDASAAIEAIEVVASTTWRHPAAIYVCPSREGARHTVAVLWKAGPDSDTLAAQLQGALDARSDPGISVRVSQRRDLVVLAVHGRGDELDFTDARHQSLAQQREFQRCVRGTQAAPAFVVYVNGQQFWSFLDETLANHASEEDQQRWHTAQDALGIRDLKQLLYSGGFRGRRWASASFLDAPAPRRGLMRILDGAPIDPDILSVVPHDATWFRALSVDLHEVLGTVRSSLAELEPKAVVKFDQALAQAAATTGVHLEEHLLAALGDQWVAYTCPPEAASGAPFQTLVVFVNRLRDPGKAQSALATLQAAGAQMASNQSGLNSKFPPVSVQTEQIDGVTVNVLSMPQGKVQWAIHGHDLLVSATPGGLQRAVQQVRQEGGSVFDHPSFAVLRKRLEQMPVRSVNFTDLPRTARAFYDAFEMVRPMAQMFLAQRAPQLASLNLPPLERMLPHLGPAIELTWVDANGGHSRALSPFPGARDLGPEALATTGSAAALAAVGLPALQDARIASARRADRDPEHASDSEPSKAADAPADAPEVTARPSAVSVSAPAAVVPAAGTTSTRGIMWIGAVGVAVIAALLGVFAIVRRKGAGAEAA